MRRAIIVLAVVLMAAPSVVVRAWGPAGHRAVAIIAAARLTPVTTREVASLLGGASIADVASWADDVRDTTHKHTTGWHFTNIAITSSGFRRSRDCVKDDCVVAAIERQEAILADRTKRTVERAEALRFLVHLIGDVHQPLHAGDNGDRGGNRVTIVAIGGAENLHAAWDSGVINAQRSNTNALVTAADAWLRTQTEATIAGGSLIDWANESQKIARDIVYPQVRGDGAIAGGERVEALRIIEKRIARAGVRLAAVLNRAIAAGQTE